MSTAQNLLTEWATLLLGSLQQAGIQDVVLSPGSRSAPFALAAARTPGLRLHDVLDERAAAFFALGQVRATGRPSLLLCTSGTAGAHYLPAVIEAGAAHLPLLVLTADRPFELQGCAAPQTVDQIKLFGDHARTYVELGLPDDGDGALRALRRVAAQAALTARWPVPGAVHLNARARKPLEPRAPGAPREADLAARVQALLDEPLPRAPLPRPLPDPGALDEAAAWIRAARRGLLVCGPAPLSQAAAREPILELARRSGFPLLCEATSQLRFAGPAPQGPLRCDLFEHLLRAPRFRANMAPDLVLQLGAPPTSSAWDGYLAAHPGCRRIVVAPHGWPDPTGRAALLVLAEPATAAAGLLMRLGGEPAVEPAWRQCWRRGDLLCRDAVAAEFRRPEPSEGAFVDAALRALPSGSLLVLGNSLPIRQVDALCPGEAAAVDVLSQRGANGIDGLVSGAAGAASVARRPVTLLIGDISFLHDLSGLQAAGAEPLCVVVLNNQGGRIFEQLPLSEVPEEVLAHFTTPHAFDLGHAARLFGHRHLRVETPAALARAVSDAHQRGGCAVIEALVPPVSAAAQQRRLDEAVGAALSGLDQPIPGDLP